MIRVLHITSALRRNGTETFIMNVFRNIDRSEIQFDFLVSAAVSDGYEEEAKSLGADIYYISSRRQNPWHYKRSLNDFFKAHAHKYQAVHYCGTSFTDVLPIKLARKYGVPIRIVHSHGSYTSGFHNILLHKLNKSSIHKIATHFLACSNTAREWGFGDTKAYESSLVIPNGLNLDNYRFNPGHREECRKELGLSGSTFTLCHTGAFLTVKNHPFIIEIFEEIRKRRTDAVLLLCGAGPEKENLTQLVREKGLEESVKFLGIRKDVGRILSAADAYIFPSLYEGLPFALIEAQASGLNTFVSDRVSEEIKLTENLKFIPLEEGASAWADLILNQDYKIRSTEIGEALRQYDINATVSILRDIYLRK